MKMVKKILEISGNGKGKENYKNEKLQFERKYLNGKKWNGKGYNYNEELEYEIKNGTGKVKEYDYCGKLIFVGDYINGERNGIGKEYYENGKVKFEGKYLCGKKMEKEKNIILMVY